MQWKELDLDRKEPRLGKDADGNDVILYTENPTWTIPAAKAKGGVKLEIPLIDIVVDLLRERREELTNDDGMLSSLYVFPQLSDNSKPVIDIRESWDRIKARAGITGLTFHDLRHTAGSWMGNTGASSSTIQAALGHSSITTSEKYIHLQSDTVRAALEMTSKAMLDLANTKKKVVEIGSKK